MNANLQLAQLFIDELARQGVQHVCIAPGSRSTPLTLACYNQPGLKVSMHLDERSAAFFALGLALSSQRPVAVICTSGSAAANFMPAVVEARMSEVPLLLLTSDRPHELRGSGANQTIDQVKFYGDQVLMAVDMPVPDAGLPELVLRHVRTLAARAVHTAQGLRRGPVHINFPFRKPLEPGAGETLPPAGSAGAAPATRWSQGQSRLAGQTLDELAALLQGAQRGLIICGPHAPGGAFPEAVVALAQASSFPLLADALSGVRFGAQAASGWVAGAYDHFLALPDFTRQEPEVILRFGGVPTSAVLNDYLGAIRPRQRVQVAASGAWADDDHRTSWFVQADETWLCQELAARLQPAGEQAWAQQLLADERRSWQALEAAFARAPLFDAAVVRQVFAQLPPGAQVFVGNSLAVRHLDQFVAPSQRALRVFGNRGASGIDGNVSSAAGIAAADPAQPAVAILGDITLYHDLNGLLAVRQQGLHNLSVVLLNNNGGGIFRRLPVAQFEPPFTEAFLTPHGLEFEHIARFYGLDYQLAADGAQLAQALQPAFERSGERQARLVEVRSDSLTDLGQRKEILGSISQRLTKGDK